MTPIIVEGDPEPAILDGARSGLEAGILALGHELMPSESIAAEALVRDPGYLPASETLALIGREIGAEAVILARVRSKEGGADLTIAVVFTDDRRGERSTRGVDGRTAFSVAKRLAVDLLGLPTEEARKIGRLDRAIPGNHTRAYTGFRSRNPDATVEEYATIHYERAERKASRGVALLSAVGPLLLTTGAVLSGVLWHLYDRTKQEYEVSCPGTVANPYEYQAGSVISGLIGFAGGSAMFIVGGIWLRTGRRSMKMWRPFLGERDPTAARGVDLRLALFPGGGDARSLVLTVSF